jgi:sugar/nucleoside kinase (ribokinase family)
VRNESASSEHYPTQEDLLSLVAILAVVPQRLLIVGESLVEFVRPGRGLPITQPGPFIGPFPSGAPAICADAAAVAGGDVALVSTVGSDPFGRVLLDRLTTDYVDVTDVRVVEDAVTGTAFVAYDTDGSRTFVFHVTDAAPGRITVADLGSAPERADWIHVSGASLALSPVMAAAIMEAVERVVAHDGGVSFDPNLRAGSAGISDMPAAMARLLGVASLVLPADGELEELGHTPDALAAQGKIVCATCGPGGARLYTRDEVAYVPGIQVEEVDPTGAGDTFAGVFLATFLSTGDAHRAAASANRAAAAHVSAMGPMERSPQWEPRRT